MVELITGLPAQFPSIREGATSADYVRGIQIGSSIDETGRLGGQIENLSQALHDVANHPELLHDSTPTLLAVSPKPLSEQEIASTAREDLEHVKTLDSSPGPFTLMTYRVPKREEILYARPSSALPKAVELANSNREQAARSRATRRVGRKAVNAQSVDLAA